MANLRVPTATYRLQFNQNFRSSDATKLVPYVKALGEKERHVITFMRRWGNEQALVAVPRFISKLANVNTPPLGHAVWEESSIILPGEAPEERRNIFTGETVYASPEDKNLALSSIFNNFPVALLEKASRARSKPF